MILVNMKNRKPKAWQANHMETFTTVPKLTIELYLNEISHSICFSKDICIRYIDRNPRVLTK